MIWLKKKKNPIGLKEHHPAQPEIKSAVTEKDCEQKDRGFCYSSLSQLNKITQSNSKCMLLWHYFCFVNPEIKHWGLEYVSWQHLFSDTVMAKALKMCFQTMDFIACVCDVWILEHIHAFQMSPLDLRSHFLHTVNKDHKAISVGARVHIEDLKAKNSHQTSSDTMHSLPVVCLLPGAKGPVHLAYCKCLARAEMNCFLNSFDFGGSFIRPLINSFDGSRVCVCMAICNIMQTLGKKVFYSLLHWNTLQETTPPSPNGHG